MTRAERLRKYRLKRRISDDRIRTSPILRGKGLGLERWKSIEADTGDLRAVEADAIAEFFAITPGELRAILSGATEELFMPDEDPKGFSDLPTVGGALRRFREQRGWTQSAVSQKSGLHQTRLSQLENGDYRPRLSTVLKLARAYEVPWESLVPQHLAAYYIAQQRLATPISTGVDEYAGLDPDLRDVLGV